MEKLFPEITSPDDVVRLARSGAIAGLLFAAVLLLDGVLGTRSVPTPALQLAVTVLELSLILLLAWRVWSGRSFVSAILMMALLVLATMTGIRDGLFGLAWMAAYFGLGLMMLNAIRACLRRDVFTEETTGARTA